MCADVALVCRGWVSVPTGCSAQSKRTLSALSSSLLVRPPVVSCDMTSGDCGRSFGRCHQSNVDRSSGHTLFLVHTKALLGCSFPFGFCVVFVLFVPCVIVSGYLGWIWQTGFAFRRPRRHGHSRVFGQLHLEHSDNCKTAYDRHAWWSSTSSTAQLAAQEAMKHSFSSSRMLIRRPPKKW